MIKKLRIKFVATALLAVLLVLVIMMGAINYLNYREVVSDADELLAILAENNGEMPTDIGPGGLRPGGMFPSSGDGSMPELPDGTFSGNTEGTFPGGSDGLAPELPEGGFPYGNMTPPETGNGGDDGSGDGSMPAGGPGGGMPGRGGMQDPGAMNGESDRATFSYYDNNTESEDSSHSAADAVAPAGPSSDFAGNSSNSPEEAGTGEEDDTRAGKKKFDTDDDDTFSWFRKGSVISEETRFESRYFSVILEEDGTVSSVSTDNIAAVSGEEAQNYAAQVHSGTKSCGFMKNYRFIKAVKNGKIVIVFLDCTKTLGNFKTFLLYSLIVSLIAFAGVAVLIFLVSGRILKPVAESYDKQKGFITDAGHELKTPVAVIEADASVLELEIGENEWVDDIKKQTGRLAQLTGELTYLARMDEGRTDTQKIEFPISDVVEDIASSFQSRSKIAEKTFSLSIEPMLSYVGDEAQIRKLTSILLDNAVKYSADHGEIRLNLAKKGKNIELSVYNTVDSIDPEMTAHMFDRFYRGDKSRSSESGGFGIGLSIAQSIVTAHKGKISAAAKDGDAITITAVLGA